MGLKSEFGDDGLPLCDKWSQSSDKYKATEIPRKWASFRNGGIGFGTVIYLAKEHGFTGQISHPPASQPAGPSWLTFIGHCRDSLWSVDLFRCESLTLNSNWVLVVMDQYSRSIVGFSAHSGNVDGIALCRMFNQASSGRDPPCYLSSDNDPLFRFHRWRANLRILEIEEIKTVPFTPISHPFVERLIGTIRRDYLDHVPFWNSLDLQRKLDQFKKYYNQHRTHTSLAGQTPDDFGRLRERSTASLSNFIWKHHCNGLFVTPIPA